VRRIRLQRCEHKPLRHAAREGTNETPARRVACILSILFILSPPKSPCGISDGMRRVWTG